MSLETVLSQHDVRQINYGGEDAIRRAGSSRPSGPWDAAEYGISLETAQARWDRAQTPEAKERVVRELRALAIRRASLDTSTGKVAAAFAGKPGWHGLGVTVSGVMTGKEARELASLNFKVLKRNLFYAHNGFDTRAPDTYALVRDDTGAMLATCGPRYTPIQNDEATDFLDAVLSQTGAKYESAGSLYGGQKIWLLAHMPKLDFTINRRDENKAYALFVSPHVPGEAAACFATNVRAECANTVRMASADAKKGIRISHTGNLYQKIQTAQKAMGIAVKQLSDYRDAATVLAATKLPNPTHYFHDVLDAVLDITYADAIKGADALAAALLVTEAETALAQQAFVKKIERRGEVLEDILCRYDTERCTGGTVWSGFNAVTEYADHGVKYRGSVESRESRRMESIISGDADTMKQAAYSKALSLVA